MRSRRATSALALLLLVAGVPIVIGTTGGGPPTRLPALSALGRPLSDHDVLRCLTVAAWLLWLLFAVAVAVELWAQARHRPSPGQSRTGWRIPGLQGLAAALVVSAAVAGGPRTSAPPAPPPVLTLDIASAPPPVAVTTPSPAPTGGPAGYLPYTVVRYDCPWDIAATHLGSGLRWKEILDTDGSSLVDGTEVVATSDGPAVEATARTIYPGQVLWLPPGAAGLAAAPPPPAVAPPAPAPAATAPATTPPVTIWSGSIPEAAAVTAVPTLTATVEPAAVDDTTSPPSVPLPDLLLGGALVASAGTNLLAFRRSRQAGRARPGERPRRPDGDAAATERRLRAVATPDVALAAHQATRLLEADLTRHEHPAPRLEVLLVGADVVEAVTGPGAGLPPPWRPDPTGDRWSRPLSAAPPEPHIGLYPALTPVGQDDRGAQVLIDLEATPITAIDGDLERATALVHAVALSLAGLPWAGSADVVLIGFGTVLARCRPHLRAVRCLDDLTAELHMAASSPGALHPPAARLAGGAEGLTPTILLLAHPPTPAEAVLLRSACRLDTPVRALVAGDVGAGTCLHASRSGLTVPGLAAPITPTGLSAADVGGLDGLLRLALADPARPGPAGAHHLPTRRGPDPEVEAQVLGPIEIAGLAADFRRAQAKEVLVYLALHREGVAEHQLDGAIWPERPAVRPTTRDPVVSAARSAAGGPARIPFAQGQGPDKRYRATDAVGTDWERFGRLHRQGRAERRPEPLIDALALVRGRPFADVVAGPGYSWLHLEGHLHHIEADIVDAADLAAELLIDAGEPRRARWAADRGLVASPYSERLWARLMAAADALGEAQEIERILAEMDRRLDLEGDFSQLHPETLAAYRRYSRRSTRLSGPSDLRPGRRTG